LYKDIIISSRGFAGSILSFSIFTSGYPFDPAVGCFRLSQSPGYNARYPLFLGFMEAKFFQIDFQVEKLAAFIFGFFILIVICIACLHSLLRILQKCEEKDRQKNISTFILPSFP